MGIRKEARKISGSLVGSWLYASLLVSSFIMMIGLGLALPVYLSPLDNGALSPNTEFDYVFNFTTGSDCTGVLLSNSSTITTDSYGFGFVDLDISSLSGKPGYLCEYRDGELRKVHNFSDMVMGTVWASGLNVDGSVSISGTDSANAFRINDGSGNLDRVMLRNSNILFIGDVDNNGDALSFRTSGSDRMRVDANGNVGIGTTSPQNELNVIGTVNATAFVGDGSGLTGVGGGLWTNSSGDATYVDGNVGIGTAEPQRKLDIITSSNSEGIRIRRDSVTTNDYATLGFLVSTSNTAPDYAQIQAIRTNADSSGDTDFAFDVLNSGSLTERMRIKSNGNVGIGTASPGYKLEVDGSLIKNNADTGVDSGLLLSENNAGKFILRNDASQDTFSIYNYGTASDSLSIDYSGNVGIGTASPQSKLHILRGGTAGTPTIQSNTDFVVQNTALDSSSTAINLLSGNATGISILRFGDVDDDDAGRIQYRNSNNGLEFFTSGTQQLTIDQSGNVGIGTTSPSSSLQVSGNIDGTPDSTGVHLGVSGGYAAMQFTGSAGGFIDFSNSTGDDYDFRIINDGSADTLEFRADGADNILVLDGNNGNVGIGTTSPLGILHLDSSTNSNLYIDRGSDTNAANMVLRTGVVSDWIFGERGTSDSDFHIYSYGTASDALTILRDSGNVGIGTTGPGAKLEVNGSVSALGESGGGYGFNGNSGAFLGMFSTGNTLNIVSGSSGQIRFGDVSSSTKFGVITTDGNWGIGTTSPSYKLEVNGSSGGSVVGVRSSSNNLMFDISDVGSGVGTLNVRDNTGSIKVKMHSSGDSYFTGGNVGIGTTGPSVKLEVNSDNVDTVAKFISADTISRLQVSDSADDIYLFTQTGKIGLGFEPDLGTLSNGMVIDSSGDVGIGTTSPSAKLEVNGSVNVTNGNITIESQNKMCFNADCSSYIWHNGTNLQIVG